MKKIAGLSLDKPLIMGIVNVTPDSFSDGGLFLGESNAIDHALRLEDEGADILDIGGESTRPGADIVSEEDELKRVLPVIRTLKERCSAKLSIDTRKAEVMRQAMLAGVDIINDVSALTYDEKSLHTVATSKLPVILMHSQGLPQDMQDNPKYDDVIGEIITYFKERLLACQNMGIDKSRIALDPGIGFGKTLDHNLQIFAHLERFEELGCPVLIGASRKSFIGMISGETEPKKRISGSLAAALWSFEKGAKILRVHDVFETKQSLDVWQAIRAYQAEN